MARVRVRVVLFLTLLLVVSWSPSSVLADLNRIQPGDYVEVGAAACTLNFVYDGPGGASYVGTAAHCVSSVGQRAWTTQYGYFGTVAWIGDANNAALDFAFIEVDAALVPVLDPAMRGHPDWPSGHTTHPETRVGDRIQVSGYGFGYELTFPTQTRREGVHVSDTATRYKMNGLDTFGDSGGPLVHIPTGKAYGIVSRFCVDVCTSTGPTLEGVLAYAASKGFPVTLRTA